MSETDAVRNLVHPRFTQGLGIDIGFGNSALTPNCLTLDRVGGTYGQPQGSDRQIFQADCRKLPWICDEAFSWLWSSHVVEDFQWPALVEMLKEWRRILRPGGLLMTCAPYESRFREHCSRTGQSLNLAHANGLEFGLENFRAKALNLCGPWEEVFCEPDAGPYSFVLVVRKL